jgi:hypothetical protein
MSHGGSVGRSHGHHSVGQGDYGGHGISHNRIQRKSRT